jgi:hypothetical protein
MAPGTTGLPVATGSYHRILTVRSWLFRGTYNLRSIYLYIYNHPTSSPVTVHINPQWIGFRDLVDVIVRPPPARRRSPDSDPGMSVGLWLFPYSDDGNDDREEGADCNAVLPKHVRRVQTERGVCEDDLIAIRLAVAGRGNGRTGGGTEDVGDASTWEGAVSAAWTLSMNARDDSVALCEGVIEETERLCGVCYDCQVEDTEDSGNGDEEERGGRGNRRRKRRGEDWHWRDRGWDCHPQRGLRRLAALPIYSP